jgi:3',5'-cyclic-AMP phosphodiesterase
LGLVGGWVCGRLSWPLSALATGRNLRLALLSDAHLKSGDDHGPEAQALARAVAQINALSPAPDLVLFAGDLAHQGRPDALELGREIFSDLSAPLWAVRGEGDCGRAGIAPWTRRFGSPRFSWAYSGVHFLGLDTVLLPTPRGPAFTLGPDQRHWLAQELAPLDSATPLVVVSHAPLARLFLPWQQWTVDATEIMPLLARFGQVLFLHGHVHGPVDCVSTIPFRHYSLPSTAWPRPQAVQGTPAVVRPGKGPHGCGWALVTLSRSSLEFRPQLWQA